MTGGPPPHDHADPLHPMHALLLSLVMPWRACRRAWRETTAVPSLLYHGIGLFVFFIGLTVIDSALWYGEIVDEFSYLGPGELPIMLLVFAVWLIVIELCYFFTALLTSCWGAGHERFRDSFGRTLSRWYQLTPFHAVITLAFIVAIEILQEMQWSSWDYDYSFYSELWDFIYSCLFLLVFMLYCGVGGWFTLRALAVPRNSSAYAPKCRWPGQCETCGYALVGMTREQTCPECGRAVDTSLNTPRGNTSHTTLAKMRLALFNPAALGEILQTHTRKREPAKALAISALALLLSGPIGVTYIVMVTQVIDGDFYLDNLLDLFQLFVIAGLGTGLSAMLIGVTIALSVGSLIGLLERLLGKRNSLPAASQAACYASGYAVFMGLLMYGFTGALAIFAERYLGHMGYGLIAILPLIWLTVCLLLVLPYCVIVGRIVRAARYANV